MTATQVHTALVRLYKERYPGRKPHSVRTTRRLLREIPPIVRDRARDGRKRFQEKHEPYVRRDLTRLEPNELWSTDHRQADVLVLVPDGRGTGWPARCRKTLCPCGAGKLRKDCCSLKRSWYTIFVDVASAAILEMRISIQPNSSVIAHGLHAAITRWGLPQGFQTDNGKDYKSWRISGSINQPRAVDLRGRKHWPALLPDDVLDFPTWRDLGVELHRCLPFRPQSKYAETILHAFAGRFENLLYGFCGRRPEEKPEKLAKEIAAGRILTIREFADKTVANEIYEWNWEHPGVGKRTKPPIAYYKGFLARWVEAFGLTFLLQRVERVKVRRGAIQLGGVIFSSKPLARLSGPRILAHYDPASLDIAYCYPGNGRCIVAFPQLAADPRAWGEANKQVARARRAQRRAVVEFGIEIKGACPRQIFPALLQKSEHF